MKKYACLYGNQDFTAEEQAEIGRFAANLMKLASEEDEMGINRLFHNEFKDMDDDTFDHVDRYFEFLANYDNGAGMSKTAKVPIESVLSALALGLAASGPAARIIGKISQKYELKNSLKQVLQRHPELRRDPNVPEYFQAIVDFAPAVAKNPLVAGNIIMQMHRVGPAHVTPQLIGTLVDIQKEQGKEGLGLGTMAEPVAGLSEAMRAHKKAVSESEEVPYGQAGFWSSRPR